MARSLPGYEGRGDPLGRDPRMNQEGVMHDRRGPMDGGDPLADLAAYTEGVLSRRLFAWLFDIVFIFLFSGVLALGIFVLGLLTFTLGWALFAILPASGVIYSALLVGGRRGSTWGMRLLGLRVVNASGGRADVLTAAVHALLFYLAGATGLIWVLDVLVGLLRPDRRLGHDLLSGLVVVRA